MFCKTISRLQARDALFEGVRDGWWGGDDEEFIASLEPLTPSIRLGHGVFQERIKAMFQFPAVLLWIPILANGYVAGMLVQFAWKHANGVFEAQADFEIAMLIAAVSLPIACLFVVGLAVWAAMRFAVRRSISSKVSIGPLAVSALNIAAPFLLWFSLKWIVR